ncbi:MAG: hypothetical protein IPG96_14200 [Proteobacteria bacterium]|nr:hypothetical protein [Pseudomonadota bacterium]
MPERAGRLDRLCAPPHRALGLALALAMGLGASTSCRRGERAAERARQVAAAQTAPPAELLVQGGLRAPGVLIDRALQLVAGGMPLPLGREPIVQLALGMVELPAAVAAALDLDRPLHFASFDARLGEHATLVALPIRSARAFGEALRATLEERGREGELALWWPKGPAGQLRPLRAWNDERVALLAGSRRAFEHGRAFVLGRLVPTPLAHDLVLRVHVPAGSERELDRILRHELTSLDGGSIKGSPLLGSIAPPAGRARASAVSSALTGFIASARAIELFADFDGSTLRLGGRAEARPGGALARTIKRQRTAAPFGAALAPPGAWLFASLSRTPDPTAKDELLESLFRGAEQSLPPAERAAFAQAAERLRGRLIGDAALAVGGAPAGRGIGVTLLARLDGRPGAAGEVEIVAQALQRATLGPPPPVGSRSATPVEGRPCSSSRSA